MADVGVLQLSIQDNSSQAASGLNALAGALERVRSSVGNGMNLEGVAASITRIGNAINTAFSDATITRITTFVSEFSRLRAATNSVGGAMTSFAQVAGSVNAATTGTFRDVAASTNEAAAGANSAATEMREVGRTVGEAAERTDTMADRTRNARSALDGMNNAISGVRTALTRMFPTLSNFISSFTRMARTRLIRAMIKQITSGITTGIENAYRYSQKLGSSFATNMDSAASSLLQMKNSIGAALMPVLETLIPYLEVAVDWFIDLVNYANQFFALMSGQSTWTRATKTSAKAFDDVKNSATGASSAIKDLLADWDELNIIQSSASSSSSGTGTSAITDSLSMFEEVSVFSQKIKDVVDWIQEHMELIKSIVEAIGLAILAWKISNAFGDSLSNLQKLELAAGIVLLVSGVQLSTQAGYDIGTNGLNSDNLVKAAVGILNTAAGGALIGFSLAGPTGAGIGFLLGTEIALFTLACSMDQAEKDKLYGDVKVTSEDIKKEVDKLFTIPVDATLSDAKITHDSIETAKSDIIKSVNQMNIDLEKHKIKLTPESAEELLESVNTVVAEANELLEQYETLIIVGFGFNTNFSSSSDAVQKFSVQNIAGLEQYITSLGNDIGKILEDGIIDGVEEQPMFNALMQKLTNVTTAVAIGKAGGEFAAEVDKAGYGMDWTQANRESLIEYANTYNEALEKVREAAYIQASDTAGALKGVWQGMVQREMDNPGTYTEEEIEQARDNYVRYRAGMQDAIDDYVNQASAEGKEIFIENMMAAFESAITKSGKLNIDVNGSLLNDKNATLEDFINANMATNLGWDISEFSKVMDTMDMSAWELLTDEYKKKYLVEMVRLLGDNAETYSRLKTELNIPISDILTIKQDSWDEWTNKERATFIKKLAEAYGGEETLTGMINFGFNLDENLELILKSLQEAGYDYGEEFWKMFGTNGQEVEGTVQGWVSAIVDYYNQNKTEIEKLKQEYTELEKEKEKLEEVDESMEGLSIAPDVYVDYLGNETSKIEENIEGLDQEIKDLDANITKTQKDLEGFVEVDGFEIHARMDMELTNEEKTAIQMVENAFNSGKGWGEVAEAKVQAIQLLSDAGISPENIQPYIDAMTKEYRELLQIYGSLEEIDYIYQDLLDKAQEDTVINEYAEGIREMYNEGDLEGLIDLRNKLEEFESQGLYGEDAWDAIFGDAMNSEEIAKLDTEVEVLRKDIDGLWESYYGGKSGASGDSKIGRMADELKELTGEATKTGEELSEVFDVNGIEITFTAPEGMSNDEQHFIQMVLNAVNSGKGVEEVNAAYEQATELYGTDVEQKVSGYVADLLDLRMELEAAYGKLEEIDVLHQEIVEDLWETGYTGKYGEQVEQMYNGGDIESLQELKNMLDELGESGWDEFFEGWNWDEQFGGSRGKVTMPEVDKTEFVQGCNDAASAMESTATRIRAALSSLNGITWTLDLFGNESSGSFNVTLPTIPAAAEGGVFTSGQIFTANENGRAEMIGSFGNNTAVANNEQIVTGISYGVSQANSGVESRLDSIESLVVRILNKEFSAKVVPSSSMGRANVQSANQYSKVTGVY